MDNVKISASRDQSRDLVLHRAVGCASETMRSYGLWLISGSVEWPSQRNGYELVKRRVFDFYSLSQMVGGEGYFSLFDNPASQVRLVPGDVIVICPGDVHRYGGTPEAEYLEDSLRFSGPLADRLREIGILRSGVYHWGTMRTLREIIDIQCNPSTGEQLRAAVELQRFLLELRQKSDRTGPGSYIDELLTRLQRNPGEWWTVEQLSEMCGVSPGKLRRDFLARTGLLPKAYIESLKMRTASELLGLGASVTAAARRMGYRDPYHFSRRFKRYFGAPPEHYKPTMAAAPGKG